MRTPVTPKLIDEVTRWSLRYACDDCAHFVADLEQCANGWPLGERRRTLEIASEASETITFCKEFEA